MKDFALTTSLAIVAVFTPIHAVLIVVGVLISVDFFTGILRSLKIGNDITSKALSRTVTKMLAYQLAVITAFLLEKYLLDSAMPAAKIVASVIGITEFKSILENTEVITGKPVFKTIIDKLNSKESGK